IARRIKYIIIGFTMVLKKQRLPLKCTDQTDQTRSIESHIFQTKIKVQQSIALLLWRYNILFIDITDKY
ncbi:hypothetical protein LJC05_01350, partial [Bacteroides sp. OttesenSCG-928-J23]|nr:hypothetical protein [Bacteroides sp. OttesenSCG-928-J23]